MTSNLTSNDRVKMQIGNLVVALAELETLQAQTQARVDLLLAKAVELGIDLEPKTEAPKP